MHFLSAQKHAFKISNISIEKKILDGYKGKISEEYPELIKKIIEKLVKSDHNERADYHEIAQYEEINKHFKTIIGVTEEEKL